MKSLRLFVCTVVAAACSPSPSPGIATTDAVLVELDRPVYAYGDTATVVVTAVTDSVVLIAMMCDVSFEGKIGDEWTAVYEPDCSLVRVRPSRLGNGESANRDFVLTLWEPDEDSTYNSFRVRARFQFEHSNYGYVTAYSSEFRLFVR